MRSNFCDFGPLNYKVYFAMFSSRKANSLYDTNVIKQGFKCRKSKFFTKRTIIDSHLHSELRNNTKYGKGNF